MRIDKALVQKARQSDLKTFLETEGFSFNRNGDKWRCVEHSSLIVTDNRFYWNSRSMSGNSIDFLVECLDYSFKEALSLLTDEDLSPQKQKNFQEPPTTLKSHVINNNKINRAFAYLSKQRLLSTNIITQLVESNHIKMISGGEYKYPSIAFTMFDENNKIVGHELNGTLDKIKFKGITPESVYGYGFNIKTSTCHKRAFFFESSIDLISFYQLYETHLKDSLLVSLAGLKINVIEHTLKRFKGISEVLIATDDDNASLNMKKALKDKQIVFTEVLVPNNLKDWNDFLKSKSTKAR